MVSPAALFPVTGNFPDIVILRIRFDDDPSRVYDLDRVAPVLVVFQENMTFEKGRTAKLGIGIADETWIHEVVFHDGANGGRVALVRLRESADPLGLIPLPTFPERMADS